MTKAKAKTKAVAAKDEQLPAYMRDTGDARGNENVDTNDLALPRFNVLQDISPQLKAKNEEHIEGSAAGMIFNTLTNELYKDGVTIVPV